MIKATIMENMTADVKKIVTFLMDEATPEDVTNYLELYQNKRVNKWARDIDSSFTWTATPQGWQYWCNLQMKFAEDTREYWERVAREHDYDEDEDAEWEEDDF